MAMQDLMSANILKKLNSMKESLINEEVKDQFGFDEKDEEKIHQELMMQARQEDESEEIDDDFFTSLSGPSQANGNEKLVEVEYMGRIGYVDISFEQIDEDVEEKEAIQIVEALETMAYSKKLEQRKEAAKKVEQYGEKSIPIIFRECRKFDLTEEQKKNEIINLLSRLSVRSLKGRKIIKAVLEKANSTQHIHVSILGAGAIREKEATDSILRHMKNPELMSVGLDSLIRIRDKKTVQPVIDSINNLDTNRHDIIDQIIALAPRFSDFGPDAVQPVFNAYIKCENRSIRPIYTIALRSFKEDAVPVLSAVLEDETNEGKLIPICASLGGLRMPFATNLLVEAFHKYPLKKRAIMLGFSYTNDKTLVPLITQELNSTHEIRMKQDCLNALAYLGENNKELIPAIKPLMNDKRGMIYLDAINCLVRLGDRDAFDKYIDILMNGYENEQHVLQRHLPKMPFRLIVKIAEKMLDCPDEKALLLVTSLQRANIIPKEVGIILEKKLQKDISPALKLEIYRLIAKHVNKRKEVLSQDVLYQARKKENDPTLLRELDQIIKNMRKEKGSISTVRNN